MKRWFLFVWVVSNLSLGLECKDATAVIGGAVREPSVRIGVKELRQFIRITRTSPEKAKEAERVLESLTPEKVDQLLELSQGKLRDQIQLPKVANNLEHVENQHLKPLEKDAQKLAEAFRIDPKKLMLLMAVHDLGKVEIPADMANALQVLFPNDFVAREILTHEYASMYWIEKLGKEAGFRPKEIYALQTLIANHNFGPDLSRAGNAELTSHWWPTMFREKLIPVLASLGINIDQVYPKSTDGKNQYGHAEDGKYSGLLSAYDRAIANEFNQFGIATWQKFSEQDYNAWTNAVKAKPELETTFSGQSLVNRMKTSAEWANSEVESLWQTLAQRYAVGGDFSLQSYEPYLNQKLGIENLKKTIARIEKDNPTKIAGSVNYKANDGTLYRVDDKKGPATKARVMQWDGKQWLQTQEGDSPVKLLFDLVKNDGK